MTYLYAITDHGKDGKDGVESTLIGILNLGVFGCPIIGVFYRRSTATVLAKHAYTSMLKFARSDKLPRSSKHPDLVAVYGRTLTPSDVAAGAGGCRCTLVRQGQAAGSALADSLTLYTGKMTI